MTTQTMPSGSVGTDSVKQAVDTILEDFIRSKRNVTEYPQTARIPALLSEFMNGGKRIRPLLSVTGWQAAGGDSGDTSIIRIAASLEMFHAFALIHDDIMDDSDTRRGRPTIHKLFTEPSGHDGDGHFGLSAAVLLGDLAFAWSDELLHTAELTQAQYHAVMPLVNEMRTEVMLGQFLDLKSTGCPTDDVDATLTVNRYKTAKYTVERPLQVGAALAGAGPEFLDFCTAFALPLGEAFQLRDDLLGVYGDVHHTGKSRLDDLRAGKNTTLLALALRACDPEQAARLRLLVGDPLLDEDGAAQVRAIFASTRARDTVERMIDDRYRQALRVLETAPFTAEATTTLRQLARKAIRRNS